MEHVLIDKNKNTYYFCSRKSYLRLCRKTQASDGFSSPNRYLPVFYAPLIF